MAGLIAAVILLTCCTPNAPANDPELARFLKTKQNQADNLALETKSKLPAAARSLFDYLQSDNWSDATNTFAELQRQSRRSGAPMPPSTLQTLVEAAHEAGQKIGLRSPRSSALEQAPWHAVVDAHWAYVTSKTWRREPLFLVTRAIQEIVPPGAIFFGDSDLGRFAISCAMESQQPDKRFSVITQNQLVDYSYWDYVRYLWGTNITMPSDDDFNAAYARSVAGAYGTGTAAIAAMNAEFSRWVFQQNPGRQIYMEASWFMPEWAYDYAVPWGPVFEIRREPIARLEQAAIQRDHAFWSGGCKRMVGNGIRPEISIGELCDLVETIYLGKGMSDFKGDPEYLSDTVAQAWFGMARHATAALYQWHCIKAKDRDDKQRMLDESIFAYKQTFVLSPFTSLDFAGLLSQMGRTNEAARIVSVREKIEAHR